jgi:hypothetical protein
VSGGPANPRAEAALAAEVHDGAEYRPFGTFTGEDAKERAEALGSVGGWGPLARAAKVARAWAGLAVAMAEADAATVADLDPEQVATWAERLWVIPPEGGMI